MAVAYPFRLKTSAMVVSSLFKMEAPMIVCQTPFLLQFRPVIKPARVGAQVVPTW